MSCSDVMYQPSLPSCFSSFTPTSYPSVAYHQQSASYTGASSSSAATCSESLKKFSGVSSRMYADRYLSPGASFGQDSCALSGLSSRLSGGGLGPLTTGKDVTYEDTKPSSVQQRLPTSYEYPEYPRGDAAAAVEDHFTRSLYPSSQYGKGSVPMNNRNLPPSFWNPTQQAPQQSQPTSYSLPYHGYASSSTDFGYSDPYYASTSFHTAPFQHGQADPWHYAYNSAAAAAQTLTAQRAAALAVDFTANRFNSSYNSLYFPSTSSMRSTRLDVTAPCKSSPAWATHTMFGADGSHYGAATTEYESTFSGRPHTSKDIYWH